MIFRLLICFLLLSGVANADIRRTVETVASTDSITSVGVPLTSTKYSKSISLSNYEGNNPVGVMYKATSSGTVGVTIQAERSYNRPTTEGSVDETYVEWNPTFTPGNSQAWKMATLDTVTMPYLRFKLTGTGSNDGSTTVQFKVQKQ